MGPENRTVTADDKFLRVNLLGDFVGYTNIPSFEDFYLVVPRQVCLLYCFHQSIPLGFCCQSKNLSFRLAYVAKKACGSKRKLRLN